MEDFELVGSEEEPDIIDQKLSSLPDLSLYLADLEYLKSKNNWVEEYSILEWEFFFFFDIGNMLTASNLQRLKVSKTATR